MRLPIWIQVSIHLAVVAAVLAGLLASAPLERALAASAATSVRLRIGVTSDGIVQVTGSDLAAAGVDLASVDPRTFALASMGASVAITVSNEASGVFGPADRILFFGQKFRGTEFEEKYTDERIYWLDIGGAAGPRIANLDATPQGDLKAPNDNAATVHAEVNMYWAPLWTTALVNVTQDTWFWHKLQPLTSNPITATANYTVPDPAPGTGAVFRLMQFTDYGSSATQSDFVPDFVPNLASGIGPVDGLMESAPDSSIAAEPSHHTIVTLNQAVILDQMWGGRWTRELTSAIPADGLVSGLNNVQVGAWVTPGNVTDRVWVNYWEVDYRRLFRAWQGQFDFRAEATGLHEYVVGNWMTKWVAVWDISNADQPRQLTGVLPGLEGAGTTQLRFRLTDGVESRYWLQEEAGFAHPASIRIRPSTGLRDHARGADAVIITPALFVPAAATLAAWHEQHGRRAVVVPLQDIYDEFNAGIQIAPEAIPNLLRWAASHWPAPAPAYLTLLGDGHYNMKGFNPATYGTTPDYVPPYLAFVDPWIGEVPVDMRYGDLDGDGLPEVTVGRLTANSLAEAVTVVDKIVHYDEAFRSADWQRRALFVADNPDSAGNFPVLADEIVAGYLPSDLTVTRAYLPGQIPGAPATAAQIAATKKTISDTIQGGVWLVQFTGHGAPQFWTSERLLTVAEVAGYSNGSELPVLMSFNCLDGWFVDPTPSYQALAEVQQRQPGGGAIAAISPTGDGITPDQQAFRRVLMTVLFQDNVREIGKALDLAKRRYAAAGGAAYLIQTMTLFGDPAMRLPLSAAQARRVYLPMISR